MDIDKLEAGRELDALVAEKVMGIELCHHEPSKNGRVCRHCHLAIGYWGGRRGLIISPPDYYSTDMAAAWEVWNHMIATETMRVCNCGRHRAPPRNPFFDELYQALRLSRPALGLFRPYNLSRLTPLLICRVALKVAMRE